MGFLGELIFELLGELVELGLDGVFGHQKSKKELKAVEPVVQVSLCSSGISNSGDEPIPLVVTCTRVRYLKVEINDLPFTVGSPSRLTGEKPATFWRSENMDNSLEMVGKPVHLNLYPAGRPKPGSYTIRVVGTGEALVTSVAEVKVNIVEAFYLRPMKDCSTGKPFGSAENVGGRMLCRTSVEYVPGPDSLVYSCSPGIVREAGPSGGRRDDSTVVVEFAADDRTYYAVYAGLTEVMVSVNEMVHPDGVLGSVAGSDEEEPGRLRSSIADGYREGGYPEHAEMPARSSLCCSGLTFYDPEYLFRKQSLPKDGR